MEHKTAKRSKQKVRNTRKIVQKLNNVTREKMKDELRKLKKLSCTNVMKTSSRTRLGNNIVDAFTLIERLHTKGHSNISFYQFWNNRKKYSKKNYVKRMLDFYKTRNIDEIRKYKYIYNLYFSNIAIFRPIMAMEVYCRVKAKRVLDFTMGWGGRLVGACALGLDSYYGIDINTNLREPYEEMVHFLEKETDHKTTIELHFEDALKVDYSQMSYDTVLTSPPYYNLEKYRGSKNRTKESWIQDFYTPLFRTTFDHLDNGGHFCINIPDNIYNDACIPVLGKCTYKIPFKKGERVPGKDKYKEYIYVYHKK